MNEVAGNINSWIIRWRFAYGLAVILMGASCGNKQSLFTPLASGQTNIHFINTPTSSDSLNILDYLYYYNGGGVAIGDINNDGLPDIYFTSNSKGHNKLYLNKGNFKFEDITDKAGVQGGADWSTGVTMADVNGDGLLDIYVCAVSGKLGLQGHNELYINNGNQTFTESSAAYGLDFKGYSTQAAFFDYDHDGDLDCFLLNQSMHSNEVVGDTSLRRKFSPLSGGRLFRNELHAKNGASAKKFTDVTAQSGIYSSAICYGLGLSVADLNNDGWEDIYVGNDFHENDYYYINNHDGTFTESGAQHFNHYSRFSMGNDIADFDNDGQPDIITADMLPFDEKTLKTYGSDEQPEIYNYKIIANGFQQQFARNSLHKNLGSGVAFSDVALMDGVAATDWSWSPLLADFDNDGVKDLFISNGIAKRMMDLDYIRFISSREVQKSLSQTRAFDKSILEKIPSGKVHNFVFKGNIGEAFTDISGLCGMLTPTYSSGAAYADLNNDGNLDLVVNNMFDDASVFRNNGEGSHYITVKLSGNNGNNFGIGAKVYLLQKGALQYQQLMLTRGFESSTEPRLHFGLGKAATVDSMLVVWPDQTYQLLTNVKADRQAVLFQHDASGYFDYQKFFPSPEKRFTEITASVGLTWKHKEDFFNDFSSQYLIPHMLSTAGPKVAVADVNGDGLDDIYVCGARFQPGALFLQTKEGHFLQQDELALKQDSLCEGVDALFFDANNDGYPDLYVVSGGNEYFANAPQLADRLYINDGHGHFTKSKSLPALLENKSVVCAADIDHDGDLDLFIGGRAVAGAYGVTPVSYVLLNDGKGNFSIANDNLAPGLKNIGMVTSATFADLNKDGWPDLVVAGEWMPVTVFLNNKGKLEKQDQAAAPEGLWQSVYATDVDGDGNIDVVAGNYGTNSKLHASKEDPMRLYVKDMDNNGRIDQLLTYSVSGSEYTFLNKDDIERQLPVIKKTFLSYSEFAGKTAQEAFGSMLNGAQVLKAETMQTVLLKNDGKGNLTAVHLPHEMQASPIFAWLNTSSGLLSGGNLYGVLPYEGRYDASWGNTLLPTVNNGFEWLSPVNSGFLVRDEIRDIKPIRLTGHNKTFVVAVNNRPLRFFEY